LLKRFTNPKNTNRVTFDFYFEGYLHDERKGYANEGTENVDITETYRETDNTLSLYTDEVKHDARNDPTTHTRNLP